MSSETTEDTTLNVWFEERYEAETHGFRVRQIVSEFRTPFCRAAIVDAEAYGRILTLDGYVQSAERDEAEYHELLVSPAFALADRSPRRVAILGGGEGATLREVLRFPSVERCVMIDIDGELVARCREHLPAWSAGAFDDPRADLVITDARGYLERHAPTAPGFDLIIADLPEADRGSPLQDLYSVEFYELVRRCLTPGGIFVTQAAEQLEDDADVINGAQILNTARAAFDGRAWMYCNFIGSFWSEWCWVIAGVDMKSPTTFGEREIEERLGARRDPSHPLRAFDGEGFAHAFQLRRSLREQLAGELAIVHDRQCR